MKTKILKTISFILMTLALIAVTYDITISNMPLSAKSLLYLIVFLYFVKDILKDFINTYR